MLSRWLEPVTLPEFRSRFLQRQPYARPGSARCAVPRFGWETLDRLLASRSADVLVVAKAQLFEAPRPQALADLRSFMQNGVGIIMRRAEREDVALAEIARAFTEDLGGEAHIQLFVTPGGTYGFGWHYDREDVFIAQTHGIKDYFFRANTVTRDLLLDKMDFERFREEVSPLNTTRLISGDWLYIPAGWWHMAKCVEDSLSISIGVLVDEARD
jgi:50S ribosomal protein L16 3-hydroxylase